MLAWLLFVLPALEAENLAPNPGMEEAAAVTDTLGNQIKVPAAWASQTQQPYCRLTETPEHVRTGKRALELPADAFLNRKFQ